MRFSTWQFTNPGGREPNEDSVGSFSNGKNHAWIAADGLGGHSHGEQASEEAAKTIGKMIADCQAIDEGFVKESFRMMNENVEELHGPLSTAVCSFSDGETLWYANNGDSRFIFIRNKEVILRTNDHSVAFLAYKTGQISYEEIPTHPSQNRLFHCLGNELDFPGEFYPEVKIEPGDAFLLCTDGFWELIKESEIIRALNIAPSAKEWMETMVEIIKTRLLPTSDNYTAVCIIVQEN